MGLVYLWVCTVEGWGIKDSVLHASYDASYGQQLACWYDASILVTANFVVAMNIITTNKLPTSCEHESAATANCRCACIAIKYLNVAFMLSHFVWPGVLTLHEAGKSERSSKKQANPSLPRHCSFSVMWLVMGFVRVHLYSSAHSEANIVQWWQQWFQEASWIACCVLPSGLFTLLTRKAHYWEINACAFVFQRAVRLLILRPF